MPFKLRNTVFTPKSDSIQEIQKELFNAIVDLPLAEDIPEEIEKNNSPLQESDALGIMEKGFNVWHPGKGNAYRFLGTDNLHSCLGISFRDPETGLLVVAHIDVALEVRELEKILKEFEGAKVIEVRFFGGVGEGDYLFFDENKISQIKAKEIYYFLYQQVSQNENVTINVLSDNTFDKLDLYKTHHFKQDKSTTVGFAINCENGKVQVFLQPEFKTWLPYTTIANCGPIFSGHFKESRVGVSMHDTWEYKSEELVKRYDNKNPEWQSNYLKEIEQRSFQGIVVLLIEDLAAKVMHNITADSVDYLKLFVTDWLNKQSKELQGPNYYTQTLLRHFALKTSKKFGDSSDKFTDEEKDDSFLTALREEICKTNFQDLLYQHVRSNLKAEIKDENIINPMFKIIRGSIHLSREWKDYEQLQAKKNNSNNLFYYLFNNNNIVSYFSIIEEWRNKKIENGISFLIQHIIVKTDNSSVEILPGNMKKLLTDYFAHKVLSLPLERVNLDSLDLSCQKTFEHFADEISQCLASKLDRRSQTWCSHWVSMNFWDDSLIRELDRLTDQWIKNVLLPKYSSWQDNNNSNIQDRNPISLTFGRSAEN